MSNYKKMDVPCFIENGVVDLAFPDLENVDWRVIARALSRIALYNGMTGQGCAYSVAQRAVIGADHLAEKTSDPVLAAYFLLHDVHKAFLGDITTPFKMLLKRYDNGFFVKELELIRNNLMKKVYQKAAFPDLSKDVEINLIAMQSHLVDSELLIFFKQKVQQNIDFSKYKIPPIKPWGAALAEEQYCERLHRYLGIKL